MSAFLLLLTEAISTIGSLYDTVILVSSDTDLIPAIKKARDKGKKIEYIGFAHKVSYALKANADKRRLLTKEDLTQFFV